MIATLEQYFLLKITVDLIVIEALEIRGVNEHALYYNVLLLKKNKHDISIGEKEAYLSLSDLKKWISNKAGKHVPVILNINNDKIIHRITDNAANIETLAKEFVPNFSNDSFYTQLLPVNSNQVVLSICRKTLADTLLEQLSFLQGAIINVAIGPFFIIPLASYFTETQLYDGYNIYFENYLFEVEENHQIIDYKIKGYTFNNDHSTRQVGNSTLESQYFVPYAYAIHFIMQGQQPAGLLLAAIQNNYEQYKFTRLSKPFILSAGITLFCLLLLSTFAFSYYNGKYQDIQAEIAYRQGQWNKFEEIKNARQHKKELLVNSGVYSTGDIASYADQVTSILPGDIYLKRLNIYPVNTRSTGTGDNVSFINSLITIEGSCYDNKALNDWIADLKQYSWISNIIIRDYKQNKNDAMASFILEIKKDTL